MKEVFRSSNAASVSLFQSILDDAAIPYFVRNSTAPQAHLPEFWPALCVLREEDYPEAMELLRSASAATPPVSGKWKCAACGETAPGNFSSCWNCGAERLTPI